MLPFDQLPACQSEPFSCRRRFAIAFLLLSYQFGGHVVQSLSVQSLEMDMGKRSAAGHGAPEGTFDTAYAEAKRLVLEHNNPEAALECLRRAEPRSNPTLWKWADFTAALLYHKGEPQASLHVLVSYCDRYPGDRRALRCIQILRKHANGPGVE